MFHALLLLCKKMDGSRASLPITCRAMVPQLHVRHVLRVYGSHACAFLVSRQIRAAVYMAAIRMGMAGFYYINYRMCPVGPDQGNASRGETLKRLF